jgi:hypothetical protein
MPLLDLGIPEFLFEDVELDVLFLSSLEVLDVIELP